MIIENKFHNTTMRTKLNGHSSLESLEYFESMIENKADRITLSRIERNLCPHHKHNCGCVITEQ